MGDLLESTWSESVASDPKHRPQFLDQPSTTVRKEWCRRPQEAHIAEGEKYRRLSVDEISVIQGFDPTWIDVDGIKENDKIALLGNAVAPPVAKAIGTVLQNSGHLNSMTTLEICAGIGGLSQGFPYLEPIAKIEMWDVACKVLRERFAPDAVIEGDAQSYDYSQHQGKVGLLCGGPPCQPWSQAGSQKGGDDPRDVMGFTPKAVAECLPDVFIFENVPGLLSAKEHEEYRDDLFHRLRNPSVDVSYGLDYKILNAADYGVPQVRKRVFIVGINGKSDAAARRLLKEVIDTESHHNPKKPAYMKKPWVILRDALKDVHTEEPWRKWNVKASENSDNIVDFDTKADIEKISSSETVSQSRDFNRIGFWWPKRDMSLSFDDSKWHFIPRVTSSVKKSLFVNEIMGSGMGPDSFAVHGNYVESLEALAEIVKSSVKFAYWDMPILDNDSEFAKHTEAGYTRSAWLSLLYDVTSSLHRCLDQEAFVAIHTDEESSHYARNVLDEVFGHTNHITTFAWEKKYAPQNDRNTPTDSFDYIIVYSTTDRASITTKLGLTVEETKIIDDTDPRGCFTAGHKGARSGNEKSKFRVNMPPYRWKLLGSSLPECRGHFFDEITGVLFLDRVKESGSFSIEVECFDATGKSDKAKYKFKLNSDNYGIAPWEEPEDIWWLNAAADGIVEGGPLKVMPKKFSKYSVDGCHSIVLSASGGEIYKGKNHSPGTGRYWEFSYSTLVNHVAKAAAFFGKNGTSLPSQKKFMDRKETTKRISVRNWLPWSTGGKSEDGTRHLKMLAENGFGKPMSQSHAKPETLGHYLLQVFAPTDTDRVLTIGDNYAMMTSAAMKLGHSCFHFIGPTPVDIDHWNDTAAPRLRAVQSHADKWGISAIDIQEFTQAEPGRIKVLELSKSKIAKKGWSDVTLLCEPTEHYPSFAAGLRGFVDFDEDLEGFWDLNGNLCIVIDPDAHLDEILVSELAQKIPPKGFLTIMYEKSCMSDGALIPTGMRLVRIPFEVV